MDSRVYQAPSGKATWSAKYKKSTTENLALFYICL